MKKFRETPRKHGFERPFNLHQVLSWFLFAFNIILFYLLIVPVFSKSLKVFFKNDFFNIFL